jgi:uncharacterized repeat protein (TIGR03803 family)
VISDSAGNLYGTTGFGGDHDCFPPFGCGVVFELDTTGKQTVLHPFTDGADGFVPQAGVIQDEAGNLYGTTADGSTDDGGAVFKLSATTHKLTVLHTFTFGGTNGSSPNAGVIRDDAGNLYGTATVGGDLNCNPNNMPAGCGLVFKLSPTGVETVLYTFTGGADGAFPSGLIRDTAGNLYGTTGGGGDLSCFLTGGCGVVFKLSPSGKETVLYTFTGGADGAQPNGVIQDTAGNLYGTAALGGSIPCNPPFGCGVVFKVDTTGNQTVLHTFTGGTDGFEPRAGVIQDEAGNLYGTAPFGGGANPCGCGVVFKLTP